MICIAFYQSSVYSVEYYIHEQLFSKKCNFFVIRGYYNSCAGIKLCLQMECMHDLSTLLLM